MKAIVAFLLCGVAMAAHASDLAVRYVQQDGRFADTSVWLTVQRRWVIVQGCVRSLRQAQALEAALRLIDDVEAVVPQLSTGTQGNSAYAAEPP